MATSPTTTIRVPIARRERERLEGLALQYGLSLPELSRRVLTAVSSTRIPTETFEEYERPRALRASLRRALRDLHAGRVTTKL